MLTTTVALFICCPSNCGGDEVATKAWTVRIPKEVLEWVRDKAAMATLERKKVVSMNAVFVEILTKAMEADKKKGGK